MSTRYNNGSHYENHQRAAELHDMAPTLIALPRSNTANKIIRRGTSGQGKRWSTPSKLTCTLNRYVGKQQPSMASPHSGIRTLQRSLTNSGGREAVQRVHRRKIGSMPRSNCDLTSRPIPSAARRRRGLSRMRAGMEFAGYSSALVDPVRVPYEGEPPRGR